LLLKRFGVNPKRVAADQLAMHGTIERGAIELQQRAGRSRVASILRKTAIAVLSVVLAIVAAIAAGIIADNTEAGRTWLIKYGFEYPGDCGG
jgi:hypothetical protein